MRVFRTIANLSEIAEPLHLAIGVFDGVHLGHAAVIRAALDGAEKSGGLAMLATFDPHPIRVLRPDDAPRILTHTAHKLRRVEQLGINHALVVEFDDAFARKSGARFIRELHAAAPDLRQVCVGRGWKFGHQRSGDFALLDRLGKELGFEPTGVDAVQIGGKPVSSTEIRELVREGNLDGAAELLGAPYSLMGTVVKGDQLGRTLGFPTANLAVRSEQLPPSGVYAVNVLLGGEFYPGVANLGTRPTIAEKNEQRRLEVHVLDYPGGDFYGEEVEIVFCRFLRAECKFSGPVELSAQIRKDVSHAREVLNAG